MSNTIAARRSDIAEKPRTVETPDSQMAFASPSFSEIHTAGLGHGLGGPRAMSPLVAVAYEVGHPGIPIHLDLTPQSPLSFPSAVWRSITPNTFERSGLRSSGLSSRFTVWSGLRTTGTSLLDPESGHSVNSWGSIEDEVPELPAIFRPLATPMLPTSPTSLSHMSTITQPDPTMSPGFVACRGCGKFHRHGFSHEKDDSRNSGSGAWWRNSKSKVSSSLWQRRESQSTFFMDEDETSEGPGSPPVSP